MSFSNLQVDMASLPRAKALTLKRLPEAYRREIIAQSIITLGVLILLSLIPQVIPGIEAQPRLLLLLVPAAILIIGGAISLLMLIRYKHKGYAMRTHDIVFQSGLFWRKTTVLPFNRIQHAEVTHGPLQRRFGLATLKFFTAGGANVDLNIDGLEASEAEALREDILHRSANAR